MSQSAWTISKKRAFKSPKKNVLFFNTFSKKYVFNSNKQLMNKDFFFIKSKYFFQICIKNGYQIESTSTCIITTDSDIASFRLRRVRTAVGHDHACLLLFLR